MNLDETDIKILEILSKNSRTSLQKIHTSLDIPLSTVRNKVERLKKRIAKFMVKIDYESLNYYPILFFLSEKENPPNIPEILPSYSLFKLNNQLLLFTFYQDTQDIFNYTQFFKNQDYRVEYALIESTTIQDNFDVLKSNEG